MPLQTHSTMKVYRLNIREGDKQFTNKEHQPVSTLCGQQCSHTHMWPWGSQEEEEDLFHSAPFACDTDWKKKETNIYSYMSNK